MKNRKFTYRFLSFGLILLLIASFSAPVVAACVMTDCHEEVVAKTSDCCDRSHNSSHSSSPVEKECHQEEERFCEGETCFLTQTPVQAKTIKLNQAQISEFTAIAVSFIVGIPEPITTYAEKAQDFNTPHSDSPPIYLLNRVLLN